MSLWIILDLYDTMRKTKDEGEHDMALINCPECGKQVSDKAYSCPNCGFPVRAIFAKENTAEMSEKKKICPYCNSADIDKEGYCNDCGMKISILKDSQQKDGDSFSHIPHTICPKCGMKNETGVFTCRNCNYKYKYAEYNVIIPDFSSEFNGVYRRKLFGGLQEVCCPVCGSEECSHYKENKVIPGKTKTSYSANLNPLKPFALLNKKEKVIRKEMAYTESKFICNKCGKIFY